MGSGRGKEKVGVDVCGGLIYVEGRGVNMWRVDVCGGTWSEYVED